MQKPIHCVKFTKATARHAKNRDQTPPLGMICPSEPHQRSPKIWGSVSGGDRVARARCPWSSVEAGQKCEKLKEKNKAAIFSPSENRCLPASTLKPEEREFVVDSGASMHMISKKDLNYSEMDTLTKSCCPTILITTNGEVQTHEEATMYVKELDIFLTLKVIENTPAVLSLGKLCDENGYSYEWIKGQRPHLIQNGSRRQCNTENFLPIVVVNESFLQFSSFNFNDTFKTGEALFNIFLELVIRTNYCNIKWQWDSRKRRSKWNWFLSSACVKFKCWW